MFARKRNSFLVAAGACQQAVLDFQASLAARYSTQKDEGHIEGFR
jgi:hypothetical protein